MSKYNCTSVCIKCNKIVHKKQYCCSDVNYSLRQVLESERDEIFYAIRNDEYHFGCKEYGNIKLEYRHEDKKIEATVKNDIITISFGCPGEIGECTKMFRLIENGIKWLHREGGND